MLLASYLIKLTWNLYEENIFGDIGEVCDVLLLVYYCIVATQYGIIFPIFCNLNSFNSGDYGTNPLK